MWLGVRVISLHFGICQEAVGSGVLFWCNALDPMVNFERSLLSFQSSSSASGAPVRKIQRFWFSIRTCSATMRHRNMIVRRVSDPPRYACEHVAVSSLVDRWRKC